MNYKILLYQEYKKQPTGTVITVDERGLEDIEAKKIKAAILERIPDPEPIAEPKAIPVIAEKAPEQKPDPAEG